LSRAKPVSLKLVLTKLQYTQLKEDADDLGVLVNRLVLDRAIQPNNVGAVA
jgi:hypothetical protein